MDQPAEIRDGAAAFAGLRVAIVHDQLYTVGGAEAVLAQMLAIFPDADLFVLFDKLPDDQRGMLRNRQVFVSPFHHLPWVKRLHRHYFVLAPFMIEQLDVRRYDLVVSSSYLVARGIITGPGQLHVCYLHSPMRYAWDMERQYLEGLALRSGLKSILVRVGLHYMRMWDLRASYGVDHYVVNSDFVRRRLRKTSGREATVIHPPVDLDQCRFQAEIERDPDLYVTVSRLVTYKRIDILVDAFAQLPDRRLVVLGDGPELTRLRSWATPNVLLAGFASRTTVIEHLQQASAFLYAAEEDFGIAPVEAQACGAPVIAYGKGGVLETLRDIDEPAPTAVLYRSQTADAVAAAIRRFEARRTDLDARTCRRNAERFGTQRFRVEFRTFVADKLEALHGNPARPSGAATATASATIQDPNWAADPRVPSS